MNDGLYSFGVHNFNGAEIKGSLILLQVNLYNEDNSFIFKIGLYKDSLSVYLTASNTINISII